MDNIALFSLITVLSFLLLLPFTLLTEGVTFTPEAMEALVSISHGQIALRSFTEMCHNPVLAS